MQPEMTHLIGSRPSSGFLFSAKVARHTGVTQALIIAVVIINPNLI